MSEQSRRSSRTVLPPILGVPFVLLAVVLLAGAAWYLLHGSLHERAANTPVSNSVITTGHVLRSHRTGDGRDSYVATVRFVDRAGQGHDFNTPAAKRVTKLGSAVSVSYDAVRPSNAHDLSARAADWKPAFVTGIGVAVLAGLALAGAVLYVVWLIRKHPQSVFAPSTR